MTTTQLPRHGCPVCLHLIDAATGIVEAALPKPGDLTVCAYCTSILEFDSELRPQHVSATALAELDMGTMRQLETIRRVIQQRQAGQNDHPQ